jgi:hypothetical protein
MIVNEKKKLKKYRIKVVEINEKGEENVEKKEVIG